MPETEDYWSKIAAMKTSKPLSKYLSNPKFRGKSAEDIYSILLKEVTTVETVLEVLTPTPAIAELEPISEAKTEDKTETEVKVQELKAQANIFESPVAIKEVVQDFILLTYDIPNTEEGQKARTDFYKHARILGAVAHSESVYYMPWTQNADVAVLVMAKTAGSKVFVWYTKASDESAHELTMRYDSVVNRWIDELDEDMEKVAGHIREGKYGLAENMFERRLKTLMELDEVVKRRGSNALAEALATIRREMSKLADALIPNLKG